MKRSLCGWITVCCCLFLSHAAHAGNGLTRISDHVYAYVDVKEASRANSFGANAGIIIGPDSIVVIDTLVSAREAQRFLRDIREISDKPISYVIDTHYHLDHAFGNGEFAGQGAVIIAHAACRDEMEHKAAEVLANAKNYGLTAEDMAGTEITYPDITFTDRLQLHLGDLEVELIHVAPSHSKGSILVYLPGEKVVFAGDVLFTDFHPYIGDGDITGWQQTLDFLAALDADKIIPGHGPLSSKKDVADMKGYITLFDRMAKALTAAKIDPAEIAAEMNKILPARAQGDWLIQANIEAKYLKKDAKKN
ncbi:MAG: MBL fold metallo-hydrolase [Proteobacteria bacterium]|nr:MBL fold metallo-hydrolase [Pseudomonadota bacterium]MBU4298114.1 MBL fold metallo-hydrolase [Pseudomonadota bacterium]MCG2746561.1 MBL fold metallo-hydrolase [Desulfobulbaceae bacterium]